MNKVLGVIFLLFCNIYLVNAGYRCSSANNCEVYCKNIDTYKLKFLENTNWIAVPWDNGNCYFHNKVTKIDTDSYPILEIE
tara:strand:- start:293 stop:535 length:243 start_codon:yes stop_codon:yes gene_type:complete